MKKLFLLLLLFVVSCSNIEINQQLQGLPETEVFIQGNLIQKTKGYVWPYVSDEGWETARFSIRKDNTIPGYTNMSSGQYYGRPPGKDGHNRGRVLTSYPYGHYNDRDFDYYKRDKKTGNNVGMFRYVYDPKGLQTQNAIIEAPSVVDILSDEPADARITELLALGKEYLDSHILWYVVKEVGGKELWHVNGIIVDTVVGKPTKVPENVEIDIHQQKHIDWNEIKTSVHIRTDIESIKINIPLSFDDIVEQDDFQIRVFTSYYKEYQNVTVTITHNEKGITIEISNINPDIINSLKETYGDGITVEIFSYSKSISDKIKDSHVITTGKPCTIVGQITSAYNDEVIPIKIMNP